MGPIRGSLARYADNLTIYVNNLYYTSSTVPHISQMIRIIYICKSNKVQFRKTKFEFVSPGAL